MRVLGLAVMSLFLLAAAAYADNGLVKVKSPHSVEDTIDRLDAALKAKGMTVFTRINHAEGAKKVGQELRPTEVLIFGNPKVGTPLMRCGQSVAIDLPQKALAWEDETGQVWLAYNDPQYLAERHALGECGEALKKVSGALGNFAKAATTP